MKIAQPKSAFPQVAGPRRAGPVVPHVYRPQPVPKVLQTKSALNPKVPVAPPVNRTPVILQRKVATPQHVPVRNPPGVLATPVCLQNAPKLKPPAPVSSRAACMPPAVQRKIAVGPAARFSPAPFARAAAGSIQRSEDGYSTDDEAKDVREVMDWVVEAEQAQFFLPAQESAVAATTGGGAVRRTFNVRDSRSLYEVVRTAVQDKLTTFYVRFHEGRAYNIRKLFGQLLLYDASNSAVHYKTVISRLSVGGDDRGMARKVLQRLAGTLDRSTVTAMQRQAIDLLLLLGVCEGVRIGGNISIFLHTLERIEAGTETFTNAFSVADCSYVPARKAEGTGQEKHLRGIKTKVKRKRGTAKKSAKILRDYSGESLEGVKKPRIIRQRVGSYMCRPMSYDVWRRQLEAGVADKQYLAERQSLGFDLPAEGGAVAHMPYIN